MEFIPYIALTMALTFIIGSPFVQKQTTQYKRRAYQQTNSYPFLAGINLIDIKKDTYLYVGDIGAYINSFNIIEGAFLQ